VEQIGKGGIEKYVDRKKKKKERIFIKREKKQKIEKL